MMHSACRSFRHLAFVGLAILSLAATCRRDPHRWTSAPPTPARNMEFDLHAATTDYNGSLASPSWVPQAMNQLPPLSAACKARPFSPQCTSQGPTLDEAEAPNVLICALEVGSPIKGHANWAVASSVGEVLWLNFAADGDYNFMFFPDGDRGLTANNPEAEGLAEPVDPPPGQATTGRRFIELEFDSRETVAHFGTTWWRQFDDVVQKERRGEAIQALLNPAAPGVAARAAVYGLLGLDCEHNCQSEFHPVYALAIEVNASASRNQWAIFVRNWGNEGFCSRYDHQLTLPEGKLRLILPRQGEGPEVSSQLSQFASSNGEILFPEVAFDAVAGSTGQVVLTFQLPAPERRADADMLLTLEWKRLTPAGGQMRYTPAAAKGAAREAAGPAGRQLETPEQYLERVLRERGLQPSGAAARTASAALKAAKQNSGTVPAAVPILPFTRPSGGAAPVVPGRLGRSPEKEANDRALIAEICRAPKGQALPSFNGRDVSEMCRGLK